MPTVLIVDDHPLMRSALTQQVSSLMPQARVHAVGSAAQALAAADTIGTPTLILLDMNLPDGDGLSLLARWRQSLPGVPVIVVTAEQDLLPTIEHAGAAACIDKGDPESSLRNAIIRVLGLDLAAQAASAGKSVPEMLTPRQQEVLRALIAGKSNLDIANQLNISETTVKVHMTAIFKALGVVSRTQAVLVAREWGW